MSERYCMHEGHALIDGRRLLQSCALPSGHDGAHRNSCAPVAGLTPLAWGADGVATRLEWPAPDAGPEAA